MGRKSRHYRDESDPLLGYYSQTMADTSSVRSFSNSLYGNSLLPSLETSSRDVGSVTASEAANPLSPFKSKSSRRYFTGLSRSGNKVKGGDESSNSNTNTSTNTDTDNGHVPVEADANESANANSNSNANNTKVSTSGKYRVHRVSYTPQNHVQVLFRLYGSAFPQVLPFCVVNVLWTYVIYFLKMQNIFDLTFHSSIGHSFMGLLVSFLVVSRSKISYDRFMDYRRHLATSYRACREIAQFTTVYTFQIQTPEAIKWRQEVCFCTIIMLRVTMDALLYSSMEREKWEEEYFKYQGGDRGVGNIDNKKSSSSSRCLDGEDDNVSEHFFQARKLSHGRRSMIDENFRAPITLAHVLRQTIMQHPQALGYKMPVNEYRDLLNFVTIFNEAFHSFRVLVFTPYPFPLVQMTRAFLFFWVYTLPMVLLKEYRLWSSIVIVCLVSFGFVGIEYVSMALDDPFGDDTNDVDEHGMALLVYEDIYLALYRTDGSAAAFELRERVLERYKQGRGLDCYRDDLKGWDIWEPPHRPPKQPVNFNDDERSTIDQNFV